MVSIELKEAFHDLDIENKKNKLNYELMVSSELIKNMQKLYNMVPDFQIKNYENGQNLPEEQFLEFMFEDIFELQKQLILLTDKINNTRKN